jgi:hypothetical protein
MGISGLKVLKELNRPYGSRREKLVNDRNEKAGRLAGLVASKTFVTWSILSTTRKGAVGIADNKKPAQGGFFLGFQMIV